MDLHRTSVNTYILDFAHDRFDIVCNSEHPEDGRLRPKHVGAYIESIHNIYAFNWFYLTKNSLAPNVIYNVAFPLTAVTLVLCTSCTPLAATYE